VVADGAAGVVVVVGFLDLTGTGFFGEDGAATALAGIFWGKDFWGFGWF